MERTNYLHDQSLEFAIKIVNLHDFLQNELKEYVISKQIIRAGTSIGANIAEAKGAQSSADFISKLHISLKEGRETEYWLKLLDKTGKISPADYVHLQSHLNLIIGLIVNLLKKAKSKSNPLPSPPLGPKTQP